MNHIVRWISGIRMGGSGCRRTGQRLCGEQGVRSSEVSFELKERVKVEDSSDQTELRRFPSNEVGRDTRVLVACVSAGK